MSSCHCQNCDWKGEDRQTEDIQDFWERVDPGEIMPCGQCPVCHALCQLDVVTIALPGIDIELRNNDSPRIYVHGPGILSDHLCLNLTHEGLILDAVDDGEVQGSFCRMWSELEHNYCEGDEDADDADT